VILRNHLFFKGFRLAIQAPARDNYRREKHIQPDCGE
jgi:hypothetical protein